MKNLFCVLPTMLCAITFTSIGFQSNHTFAQEKAEKPRGDEFYVIESIPTPEGVVLEGGWH